MPARFIHSLEDLARRPDVVVIGGGVVGLATAFFASRAGLRPVVVERMRTPAALTSRRSGEGARAQWERPENIAMARAAIDLYARFGEVLGDSRQDAGLRRIGYLYASRTPAGAALLRDRVGRQRDAGLDDVAFLEGDALRADFPLLAADVRGGAFRAGDGVLSISRIVAGYLAAMEADILLDTSVASMAASGGVIALATSQGRLEAGTAVIAAGANASILLRGFDGAPPMRTARSSIVRLEVEGIPLDHPVTIDIDEGSFWRPDERGARITASFRGLLFVEDGLSEPVPEPDYLDRALASVTPLTPLWGRLGPHIGDSHVRTGTFAVTGDGGPVIGPLPGAERLFVNVGYGGHGIMMSIEGARRLAPLLAGARRHDPADPFAPERFHDGRVLHPEPMTLNLARNEPDLEQP